jgi:hypothetical protein
MNSVFSNSLWATRPIVVLSQHLDDAVFSLDVTVPAAASTLVGETRQEPRFPATACDNSESGPAEA